MQKAKRTFLMAGDPAYEAMKKWEQRGICCELNTLGTVVSVVNYTWPEPGTSNSLPVPEAAIDELGAHYDAIQMHLKYWKETREHWARIFWRWHDTDTEQ
jgi:hypothetical protein